MPRKAMSPTAKAKKKAGQGEAAKIKIEREFDAPAVVARVEQLYLELTAR